MNRQNPDYQQGYSEGYREGYGEAIQKSYDMLRDRIGPIVYHIKLDKDIKLSNEFIDRISEMETQ